MAHIFFSDKQTLRVKHIYILCILVETFGSIVIYLYTIPEFIYTRRLYELVLFYALYAVIYDLFEYAMYMIHAGM